MNLAVLGNRIRQRREARGLKQADVANALQVSSQAVSKWERGENAPDISLLLGLTKLLGVSADWLLGSYDTDRDVFESTVFVSSVLGYAKKAKTLPPRDVATWSNALMFQLTEMILEHDGVPVKQLADGVLCFYSGSRHRERALATARQAARLIAEPSKIALSSGEIFLGSLGHPNYAQLDILGEAVNTAFCSLGWLSSQARRGIVATASVVDGVEDRKGFGEKWKAVLAGESEPVVLYEVLP